MLHDDTLERTALHDPAKEYRAIVRAPITTLRLQDVEDIDVGSFFGEEYSAERPPLFTDVLRELQRAAAVPGNVDAHCFAELKGEKPHDPKLPGVAAAIISALRVPPSRLTWISSSFPLLMEMKALCPKHKCLYIADAADEKAAWRAAGVASKHSFLDGISLRANPSVVTAELCAWMRECCKLVAVWVSRAPAKEDTPEVWSAMEEVGVDYFTSNLPPSLKVWQRRRRLSSDLKMAAKTALTLSGAFGAAMVATRGDWKLSEDLIDLAHSTIATWFSASAIAAAVEPPPPRWELKSAIGGSYEHRDLITWQRTVFDQIRLSLPSENGSSVAGKVQAEEDVDNDEDDADLGPWRGKGTTMTSSTLAPSSRKVTSSRTHQRRDA